MRGLGTSENWRTSWNDVMFRGGQAILADDIEKILELPQSQGQSVSGELTRYRDIERRRRGQNARKDSWGAWRKQEERQDFPVYRDQRYNTASRCITFIQKNISTSA